jgi:PAS domain S-box-containing protein
MPDANPARILVVDDTEGTRYSLVRMLQRAQYHVSEATTGSEALRLSAEKPDLIILDINLPDLDGFEVCRRVKGNPSTASIPVMHMSATYVDSENRATGLERGADGYLTWPIEPRELVAHIEALLRARRAEREAREKEELIRVTLSSIRDGVIATDSSGRINFLNAMAQTLTGWSSEDAVGRTLSEVLQIINEESRQPVENPVDETLEENHGVGLANHTVLISRDGTERVIEDSAAPIRDADGNTVGAVMVFRDVTERKRAEKASKEESQRKDEFLAMLAHELRNPLAPIRSAVHVLNLVESSSSQAHEARAVISRQVEHLVRLVDDLLDMSRISKGMIKLQKERTDLAVVLTRAVEGCRPLIDARRHVLKVTMPDRFMPITGDAVRLAQVFLNLLNNAAKYTPEGGRIELSVKLEEEPDRRPIAQVRVKDTGVGIAPEMLPKVFDLFTQVNQTLDRSEGGLGIGLTLARRLTEMHGGTIASSSKGQGQGSEFIVHLPLSSPEQRDEEQKQNLDPAQSHAKLAHLPEGRRILVIDDNRDSAESLATFLRLLGNDVRTAYEGRHGVVIAASYRPDVVLLDLGLPGLNGYEVAKQLRALPGQTEVQLVAMTGFGREQDRQNTKKTGFHEHLVKPVDLDSLQILLGSLPAH